jgi:hypothetical protein
MVFPPVKRSGVEGIDCHKQEKVQSVEAGIFLTGAVFDNCVDGPGEVCWLSYLFP